MGLFAFLSGSKSPMRALNGKSPARSRAAVERLEQRVLFDVQVSTNLFDAPPPSGSTVTGAPTGVYADQAGTTNATFSMPGSSSNRVAVAYYDAAMQQYQQLSNGMYMHSSGWSYSDNGGQSFAQPGMDPSTPPLLPTVSDGTAAAGDDSNQVLAWDNANATLYLATTSWPNRSDINVYASTDGGRTFTSVMDATPGAPTGSLNDITYDKPWLAVDNNPGPDYGMVYLAYVQVNKDVPSPTTQIYVADLQPRGAWPAFSSQFLLNTTGQVQSPEVLVEPNDHVDVVYVTQNGIYLDRSDSPTRQQGWTGSPTELAAFQHTNGGFPFDDLYASTGQGTKETIINVPYYPSTAIGQIGADTYLYAAYMDGNLDGNNSPDGTFGIYFLKYDLSTGTMVGNANGPFGPIAGTDAVTDEWMPSLALSPDGTYALIGFYGGNAVYDPTAQKADEQYNTFYITGATNADGIDWSSPTQITNVDASSGQPTGGYFDQPGGPSTDNFASNPPDPASVWNPDYDGASADYLNFHYSFMETSNEQLYDSSGNPVTLDAQEDVYMANIPIPYTYTGSAPSAPTNVAFTQTNDQNGFTLTVNWNGNPYPDDALAYVEYCVAGQGWLPFGSSPARADNGFQSWSNDLIPIPNYLPTTTYYFRVRVQYSPNVNDGATANSSSAWSSVFIAPGSNTMVIRGTPGNHTIVMTDDPVHDQIDYAIDGNAQPAVPIIAGGSLLVLGGGGADQITFDLSNGNFLAAETDIDNDGGTLKLDIVGTTSNDTVSIVGGGSAPYTFDTTNVNVIAGLIESLEYDDGGGNDTTNETLGVTGMIPVMLNLSSGDSTNAITSSDSAPVYVVPGTGKIALSAAAGATIFPASTATTGIRQIDFAAISISSGAYVYFASSAALGVYTNHSNRSVAVIDAGGLSIAPGGTLDMGDNDMILNYDSANESATKTQVFNLLASGITVNGDWSGTGITSSEAAYDTNVTGTRALGMLDNNDIGYTSFDGVAFSDANEILIKFTYYGDADLSGTMDGTDLSQYFAGRSHQGTGWDFADFDYDGTPATSTDLTLYLAGVNGYKQFGAL